MSGCSLVFQCIAINKFTIASSRYIKSIKLIFSFQHDDLSFVGYGCPLFPNVLIWLSRLHPNHITYIGFYEFFNNVFLSILRQLEEAAEIAFQQKNDDDLVMVLNKCSGSNRTLAEKVQTLRAQLTTKRWGMVLISRHVYTIMSHKYKSVYILVKV